MFNFSTINLGCTKNLVDSQYIIGKILSYDVANSKEKINYIPDPYSNQTEYVFLNTCGFLSTGRKETMDTLKKLVKAGKKVYVLGCTIQYFKAYENENNIEFKKELENFNKFLEENKGNVFLLSREDIDKISIEKIRRGYFSSQFGDFVYPKTLRAYTDIAYGYEYLKIAEGCNNSCSFCVIPKIRGKQKSLSIEAILEQAKSIINNGAKELIIIAQDTTRYGIDLYKEPKLFELLEKLDKLEGDFVYRILYLYPDVISLKHLEKLRTLEKFLPYFDIPLQHISGKILKLMGRFYNTDYIYRFLDFIKKNFENPFIRTNFIVGFPGETEENFNQLIDFVKKDYFNNIALFQYHDEPLASSSKLPNKIDDITLNKRFKIISSLVDEILEKKDKERKKNIQIGYIQDILEDKLVVRPYLHCPEIDPIDEIVYENILGVYNESGELSIGELVQYKCY